MSTRLANFQATSAAGGGVCFKAAQTIDRLEKFKGDRIFFCYNPLTK